MFRAIKALLYLMMMPFLLDYSMVFLFDRLYNPAFFVCDLFSRLLRVNRMTCPARLLDKTKLYHRTADGIGRLYHVKIKIKGKNRNTAKL